MSDTRSLVRRLLAVLDDRMNAAGHPAIVLKNREHLGVCTVLECSIRCREYRALFCEGMRWLREHPAQPALFEEVAG